MLQTVPGPTICDGQKAPERRGGCSDSTFSSRESPKLGRQESQRNENSLVLKSEDRGSIVPLILPAHIQRECFIESEANGGCPGCASRPVGVAQAAAALKS